MTNFPLELQKNANQTFVRYLNCQIFGIFVEENSILQIERVIFMKSRFRTIYAKDEEYIRYRENYSQLFEEFKGFAEQESLDGGNVQKNSGKADSYARYLIRLIILHDEIISDKLDSNNLIEMYNKLLKLFDIEGFKEFNSKGKNFYSATLNCFKRFVSYSNNLKNKSEIIKDIEEDYRLDTEEMIDYIFNYITEKGYFYTKNEIKNFYLSLKTKPFVILSGISGTGKTKIAQLFAESIGASEENGQFKLIPVRPDWSDGSDLLGYVDIKGEFQSGPLTETIKLANKEKNKPFIVLLDEMNLARVEHYFSDILSVMESRKWVDGEIQSSLLLSKLIAGEDIYLPNNLYIIGTVNMDETTYPFSKKVLDRANTIEFNHINLSDLTFLKETHETYETLKYSNDILESEYLLLKDVYSGNEDLIHKVIDYLEEINDILKPIHAQFGYRVRDEISFYMAYNNIYNLLSYNEAFDNCIMQKILPRISGSDGRIEEVLINLFKLFSNKNFDETKKINEIIENAPYLKSAEKVYHMIGRLEDGFTSFWIA